MTHSLLKTTISLGMIFGLLLSPKLWLSSRTYPLTPVLAFLHPIPSPFDYLVYGAMLLLLVLIATASRPVRWIALFVPLAAGYALFDQSRWQPWFYQYLVMLVAAANGRRNICRLIIASIYFWSGIQKLNPGFIDDTFPFLLEPMVRNVPAGLGFAAAIMESAIGIGLLTGRLRNFAVIGAAGMHAFILASLGPFGHNFNLVVWPWNIAMLLMVIQLFWRAPDVRTSEVLWSGRKFHRLVLLLFTVLPALSLVDLWDSYLSFALYSGNQRQGIIYLADSVADQLPENVQDLVDVYESESKVDSLDIEDWSYDELNVPPYAEPRVFKNVARAVCRYADNSPQIVLAIEDKLRWFPRPRTRLYTCAMLQR